MEMRRNVLLLASGALAVLLSCAGLALAQEGTTPGQGPKGGVIPGRYIVVLEEGIQGPTAVAQEHAQRHGAEVLHTYRHAIKGYAARLPEGRLGRSPPRRARCPWPQQCPPRACRGRSSRSSCRPQRS